MRLLEEIALTMRVAESDATWDLKYDVVFTRHREVIKPLLSRCGIELEWCDPDTSYEADVRAYIEALTCLRQDLERLPDGCLAFADEEAETP